MPGPRSSDADDIESLELEFVPRRCSLVTMILLLLPLIGVALLLSCLQARYSRGLNKFPGPYLASFTDLWKLWYAGQNSTTENSVYIDVHEKYGEVVRIGPNSLSFAHPQAIQEIYGTKGSQQKVCL